MRMPRFSFFVMLCLVGIVVVVLAAYRLGFQHGMGQAGSSDLIHAKVVSLPQLDGIATGRSIYYQGSNKQFHYVRVESIGFFRLRRSDVTIPLVGFDGDGASSLGMIWKALTIENGQLKASDASTGWF